MIKGTAFERNMLTAGNALLHGLEHGIMMKNISVGLKETEKVDGFVGFFSKEEQYLCIPQ